MKHFDRIGISAIILALMMLLPITAGAQSEHDQMSQHDQNQPGKMIRETSVDGYELTYRLIDIREEMEETADKPEVSATHHLMLFIKSPDGQPVTSAKVGFLIEGAQKADQKVMAMGMGQGFGADIHLGGTGGYTIKSKAVFDGRQLIDSFDYTVK